MRKGFARRRIAPVALAMAIHALFAVALISRPPEPVLPEAVAIQVMLAPPWRPPAKADAVKPTPRAAASSTVRAHSPAATLAQPMRPAAPRGDWTVRATGPEENDDVRSSLRAGTGCRHADLLALTKAERQACDAKLAEGAKEAKAYAVVSPKLQKEFDGVFECPKDDVWCEYRIGKGPYPGLFGGGKKKRSEWD